MSNKTKVSSNTPDDEVYELVIKPEWLSNGLEAYRKRLLCSPCNKRELRSGTVNYCARCAVLQVLFHDFAYQVRSLRTDLEEKLHSIRKNQAPKPRNVISAINAGLDRWYPMWRLLQCGHEAGRLVDNGECSVCVYIIRPIREAQGKADRLVKVVLQKTPEQREREAREAATEATDQADREAERKRDSDRERQRRSRAKRKEEAHAEATEATEAKRAKERAKKQKQRAKSKANPEENGA